MLRVFGLEKLMNVIQLWEMLSKLILIMKKLLLLQKEQTVMRIHPGYGFLSENADFARACEANGIIFIGKTRPHRIIGDKMASKVAMKSWCSSSEGTDEPILDVNEGAKNR